MNVLLYGSRRLTDEFRGHNCVLFTHKPPKKPVNQDSIICMEEMYDVGDRTIFGNAEVIKLRKNGSQNPLIIIDRGFSPEPHASWKRVAKDPFVQLVSITNLRKDGFKFVDLARLFPSDLDRTERDHFFADLRKNLYDNGDYLLTERHRVLSQLLRIQGVEQTNVFLAKSLKELRSFLIREGLLLHVQADIDQAEKKLETHTGVKSIVDELYQTIREKLSERKTSVYLEPKHKTILYIGEKLETWKVFSTALQSFFNGVPITCLYASDEASALKLLQSESSISTVFSDYRFWKNENKLAPINGYILVRRLQRYARSVQFCFLTNHTGDISLLPPGMSATHVFDKKRLLNGKNPLEFARLFKVIFQDDYPNVASSWPEELCRNETDQVYKQLYDTYLQSPDKYTIKAHSDALATKVVRELILEGNMLHPELFQHAPLNRINRANQLEQFCSILTARKVIVGLLNVESLASRFGKYLQEKDQGKTIEVSSRPYFDIIYALLPTGTNASRDGNRKVSKFFADTYRLKLRAVAKYNVNSAEIHKVLTQEEVLWLKSFLKQNNDL